MLMQNLGGQTKSSSIMVFSEMAYSKQHNVRDIHWKESPLISYRKGKSLKDMLVKATRTLIIMDTQQELRRSVKPILPKIDIFTSLL